MRQWLKNLRLQKAYTQQEVAEGAGISQNFYSSIENGERRPSPRVAQRLGAFLGFHWTLFYQDEQRTG